MMAPLHWSHISGPHCNYIDIPTFNIRGPSFHNIIMSFCDSSNNIASMGVFLHLSKELYGGYFLSIFLSRSWCQVVWTHHIHQLWRIKQFNHLIIQNFRKCILSFHTPCTTFSSQMWFKFLISWFSCWLPFPCKSLNLLKMSICLTIEELEAFMYNFLPCNIYRF